ncbi:MAG: transposase [Bradymonadaceae bacterium]|nr:transposase [Lujinxingiaceae bacterium]
MPKPLRTSPPDTVSSVEVRAPRTQGRRRFSAAEKQRILRAADACAHGELGALLRREGIYHSQLTDWRVQLAKRGSDGLQPQRPGPAPKHDAKDREIQSLNNKVRKLEKELIIVNGLVDLQKKVQAMFSAMQQDAPPCTR